MFEIRADQNSGTFLVHRRKTGRTAGEMNSGMTGDMDGDMTGDMQGTEI